ncbi:HAD family phosphatase [Prochlorococcus sp. MIT 1300]|uniref:HAD family hydrolase n=1 Tax=Prochlorococcus sp. MIT 1300 TaxID=3096218 RepID=UPI002A75C8DF|nr:HAD family phosphatase [Prochlorococcus sp. MIT 1300]
MFLPKACLFDLDGLLLDTEPLHGRAWAEAAATFGKSLNQSQLHQLQGRRRLDCAEQILNWTNSDLTAEKLLSIQKPISRRLLAEAKAMPGAEDLIKWNFNKGLPMALVSSSASDSVAFKIKPHPWIKLIQTKVLGDDKDLLRGKPAPDPFKLAAHKMQIKPEDCWALEDSKAGEQAALAAGCRVWILGEKTENYNFKEETLIPNPIYISSLNVVLEQLKAAWSSNQ